MVDVVCNGVTYDYGVVENLMKFGRWKTRAGSELAEEKR